MTFRLSTGLRNALASGVGVRGALNKGYIKIFTGTQPATADSAETGTLLGVVTVSSGALTKETRATGSITITGAASGSINTVTVGGLNIIPDGAVAAVAGDTAGTAAALAAAINRNGMFEARVTGSVVTILGRPGSGAITAAVSATLTTVTATYGNMSSGVAPVNGLSLGEPSAGVVSKPLTEVWSFNGVAVGTAGWFRFYSSDTADTGAAISGAPYFSRCDGSVAVSGADLNLSNISIAVGSPTTIDTFNITVPAA